MEGGGRELPVLKGRDLKSRSPGRRRRSRSNESGRGAEDDQLLSFSPTDELAFAIDPMGSSESSIVIVNPATSPNMVAFKIKTTSPSRYVVKPPTQVLHIGESIIIKVSLLRNEATEALLRGQVIPNDDRFLIQSAPVDEADMSTRSNPKALKEMWSTTKWKKKTRNKIITVRFFLKTEVSDDSDDSSDEDSDEGPVHPRVGDRSHQARNRDLASTGASGSGGSGVADRSRSASVMSSKQARARAGADALARQGKPAGAASSLASAGSSSNDLLTLSISSGGGNGVSNMISPASTDASLSSMMALSDRGVHFPWKCGELLGRGTSGHVYKAMRKDTGEMIAMKVLEVASSRSQAQIMKEVEVLRELSHPHVVKYLGCECEASSSKSPLPLVRIFMEFVSGGSLSKILRGFGALEEPLMRKYTRQILEGLAHVHAHNFAHRDIKGANVLVTDRGEIKLADFGSCKALAAEGGLTVQQSWLPAGSVVPAPSPREQGTPQWMAPEVVKGKVSNRGWQQADIWSLGCTVIEMATGQPPWPDASNPATIMIRIASSDPGIHIPAHLSRDAKDFMSQCLQRDPAMRPTAAKLLEHSFLREPEERPDSASGTGTKNSPQVRPSSGARSVRLAAAAELQQADSAPSDSGGSGDDFSGKVSPRLQHRVPRPGSGSGRLSALRPLDSIPPPPSASLSTKSVASVSSSVESHGSPASSPESPRLSMGTHLMPEPVHLSYRDHITSAIDKGRGDMHAVITTLDDIGWTVYNTWGVNHNSGTAHDYTLTSSLPESMEGHDADEAAVPWSYEAQWEPHSSGDGVFDGEQSYDHEAQYDGSGGFADYSGAWPNYPVEESGEWWEDVDNYGGGTWVQQGTGHVGQLQQLVAAEESRDTGHMTPDEKLAALHRFENSLMRFVAAWPETSQPPPLPPSKPVKPVYPTLMSDGLALHWLAAARYSLRQKAAAAAGEEDEVEDEGGDGMVAGSPHADAEWYSLGHTELAPAVAIHAMSEHVAKVRCQASETSSAYSGLRLLVASSGTDGMTPTGIAPAAPLHREFPQLLASVSQRSESLSRVTGSLMQSMVSHEQGCDGWPGQWKWSPPQEATIPALAPPPPGPSAVSRDAAVEVKPLSLPVVAPLASISGTVVAPPVFHPVPARRSLTRSVVGMIPENDVGPNNLPSLNLESTSAVNKLQKRLERERILREMENAAKLASDSTSISSDSQSLLVLAVARYTATSANELSIEDGDVIRVLRQDPSGWWEGECKHRPKYDMYSIGEVDTPRSGWSMSQMSSTTGASVKSGTASSLRSGWLARDPEREAEAVSTVSSTKGGPPPIVPLARRM